MPSRQPDGLLGLHAPIPLPANRWLLLSGLSLPEAGKLVRRVLMR